MHLESESLHLRGLPEQALDSRPESGHSVAGSHIRVPFRASGNLLSQGQGAASEAGDSQLYDSQVRLADKVDILGTSTT